jgi:hypothetical protein
MSGGSGNHTYGEGWNSVLIQWVSDAERELWNSGTGGGALLNLDGGAPDSIYEGLTVIDAGGVS